MEGAALNPGVEDSFLVAVLVAVVILAGYLEWSYIRGRLMRRRVTRMAATTVRDEAFNASVTTKAIMRNLKSQGYDVTRAEPTIQQSDMEMEMGNFVQAKMLAEEARELLFGIRSAGEATARSQPRPSKQPIPVMTAGEESAAEPLETAREEQARHPRNYVEAGFTIRSVELELSVAFPDDPAREEAKKTLEEAKKSYDASDYDAALRLAVKASRILSGGAGDGSSIQAIPAGDAPDQDIEQSQQESCMDCGAPLLKGDSFCRKCGKKIAASCPSCGGPLLEGDTFCGKCGRKVPA